MAKPASSLPRVTRFTVFSCHYPSKGKLFITVLMTLFMSAAKAVSGEFFEGFDAPGKPPIRDGVTWSCKAELSPASSWENLIPGDGFAHLTVERERLEATIHKSTPWPFQVISLGPVSTNHRVSIRAKNTAIHGVTCFLFLYSEKGTVNEIDLEITARDTETGSRNRKTTSGEDVTDIRMNTWARASGPGLLPRRTIRSSVIDAKGLSISLKDEKFHTYTLEWKPDAVRFYIDNTLQGVIEEIVPDTPMSVIFGMRKTPWSGHPDWKGTQTMLVDWIDIEDCEKKP